MTTGTGNPGDNSTDSGMRRKRNVPSLEGLPSGGIMPGVPGGNSTGGSVGDNGTTVVGDDNNNELPGMPDAGNVTGRIGDPINDGSSNGTGSVRDDARGPVIRPGENVQRSVPGGATFPSVTVLCGRKAGNSSDQDQRM